MKFYFSLLSILVCFTATSQLRADSIEIVNLIAKDYKTMGNWDLKTHIQNCTDKYLLIENGEIWTMKEESDYYKKNSGRVMTRRDYFDFKRVNVQGAFAYAVYNLTSEIIENGGTKTVNFAESAICKKIDGKWKIEVIHSTKLDAKK